MSALILQESYFASFHNVKASKNIIITIIYGWEEFEVWAGGIILVTVGCWQTWGQNPAC